MPQMLNHLQFALPLVVTFWTALCSLHAFAFSPQNISEAQSLTIELDKTLPRRIKNSPLHLQMEFYDTRWDDENFPPRRRAEELEIRLAQLTAQQQQALHAANRFSIFNQQHPALTALNETTRVLQTQALEVEAELQKLEQSAFVKYSWELSPQELNSGIATVDLDQVQTALNLDEEQLRDVEVRVNVSQPHLLFKKNLLDWSGDLRTWLEPVAGAEAFSRPIAPKIRLRAQFKTKSI